MASTHTPDSDWPGRATVRRRSRMAVGTWGGLAVVVAVLGSCSDRPSQPEYQNVFDSDGPFAGDPFQVTAQVVPGAVSVQWRRVSVDSLRTYRVMRAIAASGPYGMVVEVNQPTTNGTTVQYTDFSYSRGRENFYKIVGRSPGGQQTSIDAVAAASVFPPAGVNIFDDAGSARSRTLAVRVVAVPRDTVVIALTPDLAGSSYALGDTQFVLNTTIDLGPAVANGERRRLYVAARRAGSDPPVAVDSTLVAFNPRLAVLDANPVENPVRLELRTVGVELLRFALQRGDLEASPWFDPTPAEGDTASLATFEVNLAEGDTTGQVVWVEAGSDFGFTRVDSLAVTPTRVLPGCTTPGACFTIEGGSPSTAKPVVRLDMHISGATRMRFSETLPLSATAWTVYSATVDFALSPGFGEKTIHAQFANVFDAFGVAASETIRRVNPTAPREE